MTFFKNNRNNFPANPNFSSAMDAAESEYDTAFQQLDGEGECTFDETKEELDERLRDKAERVSNVFETVLRQSSCTPEELNWVSEVYHAAKVGLEDAIHENVKQELEW